MIPPSIASVFVLILSWTTLILGAPPPTLPPDEAMAATLLEAVGDGFRIRETDHFTIAHDTPPEVLRPLLDRLEGTYNALWRFCEGLGLVIKPPSKRFGVLLFDRHEDFERYRAKVGVATGSVAGFFLQETNLSAFSNTLNTPQLEEVNAEIIRTQNQMRELRRDRRNLRKNRPKRNVLQRRLASLRAGRDSLVERFNRFVIQHEAAHQMLFNIGVHVRGASNPFWLAEGLACQFEVPQALAAHGVARVNHMRLADLRDALGADLRARKTSDEAIEAALARGRIVPLVDLISKPGMFTAGGSQIAFRYAQAWSLVYYLNRKHRDSFSGYLARLARRKPGVRVGPQEEIEAFESHFGPLDARFQRAWIDYMMKLRLDRAEAGR